MNLIDQFKQIWSTSVDNSPKALNYRLYKKGVSFENYLEILKDKDLFLLCRFRTSNHRLPIEIGRWQNINRENRECNLCQGRELRDEFHYLFECTEFSHARTRLIPQKYRCSPNTVKYCALMCSNSVVELNKLCKFTRIVHSKVCPYVTIDLILIVYFLSETGVNMFVFLIFISLPCNIGYEK
jgi:hypothetical protein